MPEYTVKEGDHISKIAEQFGFADYKVIWNHANNKKLKNERKNPNVLYPGDVVFVPEKETKETSCATEKKWKFELQAQPLKLRIVVKDMADKPVASKPCQLTVEGAADVPSLATKGDGLAERPIEKNSEKGKLILKDASLPIDLDIPILIGHLHPVDKVSGWQARLNNLGYNAGEVNGEMNPQLQSAIEEFQCEHNLTVDGICGPKTQAKLLEVHGC